MKTLVAAAVAIGLAALAASGRTLLSQTPQPKPETMNLGNFSVSLAVKDIVASRAFYEKLGFKPIAGDAKQNWLILRNGAATIGLFQGMFEKNILTFNPGWSSAGEPLKEFEDVREIQKRLERLGLALTTKADESSTGPASLTLLDPDGNMLLLDQHVPKPGH